MSAVARPSTMTTEELLALPEDGVDRELIRGELREKRMTRRNRRHSRSTSRLAHRLEHWLEAQPQPRGEVVSGEAGFRLRRDPDTTVGIDVAYIAPEVASSNPDDASLIEGVPVLAVEILSPSDRHEEIAEKIAVYLEAGVALVWVVDPDFRTVTVYQPGAEPALFNVTQHLSAAPHLPGFQVPVARIFERRGRAFPQTRRRARTEGSPVGEPLPRSFTLHQPIGLPPSGGSLRTVAGFGPLSFATASWPIVFDVEAALLGNLAYPQGRADNEGRTRSLLNKSKGGHAPWRFSGTVCLNTWTESFRFAFRSGVPRVVPDQCSGLSRGTLVEDDPWHPKNSHQPGPPA